MPQLTIYHLTFPQGLHIGTSGVASVEDSRESVPSDTLFAALLATWRYLGRDVQKILPDEQNPAFRVTSAFPFAGGVRFYPKPVDLRELFSEATLKAESAGKRLKKIRYISEKLLLKAADGVYLDDFLFPEDEMEDPENGIAMQGGVFWMLPEEVENLPAEWRFSKDKWWLLRRKKVYVAQTSQRVTVDRISSASNLFQSERVIFNTGCGLWFGVTQDSNLESDFAALLRALGDSGLGGERTIGYGHFGWEQKDTRLLEAPQSYAYLLSRWHPAEDEVALLKKEGSAYKLEAVAGWLRSPDHVAAQRRKRIWMVAEGSLIAGNPQGDAVDVRPTYKATDTEFPHPVYRPGFALALDWKRKVMHG